MFIGSGGGGGERPASALSDVSIHIQVTPPKIEQVD
jgi:hypothetical protein